MKTSSQLTTTLRALVKKRIAEGWIWVPNLSVGPKFEVLLPPQGDRRRNMAANWMPYSKNRKVPHWIFESSVVGYFGFA